MKKIILSFSLLLLSAGITFAHHKKHKGSSATENQQTITTTAPAATKAQSTTLNSDNMDFQISSHDFGTVEEGPDAVTKFTFTNTGKAIIIQKAQPSCGCTVPSFSKEPIPPGGTGVIDVAYHTRGRANPFTKSITVVSNAGTKVLTIKGVVEKAPTGSVPESTSMIKTN